MEKRNLASKESGADFLAHNLTLKTPLVYAFARLKESSGVADFLYPMDYSLTFICFDWWCKMWGFAPNPLSRPEMEQVPEILKLEILKLPKLEHLKSSTLNT